MAPPTHKVKSKDTGSARRPRASLRLIFTIINVTAILIASLAAGYYALTVLYHSKAVDTWAIMFLELEHQGFGLRDKLAQITDSTDLETSADAILALQPDGQLKLEQGSLASDLQLSDLQIDGKSLVTQPPRWMIIVIHGEPFVGRLRYQTQKIVLKKLHPEIFNIVPRRPVEYGALYLLTREGRLLYASDSKITEHNVGKRDLVQYFISAPIRQGQLEIASGVGDLYGFFSEIPDTNIIMFSEVRKSAAMATVYEVVLKFILVLSVVLVCTILLLQLPLARITKPIRELADMASMIGEGNFNIKLRTLGFGELNILTNAFSSMATGLVERDKKVAALMDDRLERARLASELAIASRIQENLLPSQPMSPDSGLVIAAKYIPAAECAGDWYHYFYNAKTRESVIVIADVTGHGAGSSMFTAIIAGIFDEFRARDNASFDINGFAKHANDSMLRLGREEWNASMIVARYSRDLEVLDLLVAGHPLPILRKGEFGEKTNAMPSLIGSDLLGSSYDFQPLCRQIPFPKGSTLLAYTDGLTEAFNPNNKMFSRRKVVESFLQGDGEPRQTLSRLIDAWNHHRAGRPANDDTCLIVMRAV